MELEPSIPRQNRNLIPITLVRSAAVLVFVIVLVLVFETTSVLDLADPVDPRNSTGPSGIGVHFSPESKLGAVLVVRFEHEHEHEDAHEGKQEQSQDAYERCDAAILPRHGMTLTSTNHWS